MSLQNDVLRMMGEEAVEQFVHEAVSTELKAAADAGETGKNTAKRALKNPFKSAGSFMSHVRNNIPGWTFPLVGSAIATMLKKSDFIDRLLPGDDRMAVKEAKFLLKSIGPHAVIGAFTGARDAEAQIDRKIDEARSDSGVADDSANMEFDWVAMSSHFPGRIFVPARDNVTKKIRFHADGKPIILDPDFARFKAMWDQVHKATTKTTGKGKDQKTVPVQAESMHVELFRLTEALAIVSATGAGANTRDLEAIKKLLEKPKSWGASLTKRANDFHMTLSLTCSKKGAIKRMVAERLFKDLPGKADIALIEHMAETMEGRPRDPDGSLTNEDYQWIITHIDNFLGAELNFYERTLRTASEMWNNIGSFSLPVKGLFYGGVVTLILFNIVSIMMFLASFWWMLSSTMFGEPSEFHRNRAIICAIVLIVMIFTLKIWQTFLHPIVGRVFSLPTDWLVGFGWRFIGMLTPVFLIAIALTPEIGVSYTARWIIVALAFGAGVCSGALYKANEVPASAQLLGIYSARFGWLIVSIIIAIDWAVRRGIPGAMASKIGSGWMWFANLIRANQWFLSVALFFLVAIPLLVAVKLLHRQRYQIGVTRYTEREGHGFWTFLIVVAALIVAVGGSWLTTDKKIFDPFDRGDTQEAPQPAATTVVEPAESTPASTSRSSRGAKTSHQPAQLNCAELSTEGQLQAGCP